MHRTKLKLIVDALLHEQSVSSYGQNWGPNNPDTIMSVYYHFVDLMGVIYNEIQNGGLSPLSAGIVPEIWSGMSLLDFIRNYSTVVIPLLDTYAAVSPNIANARNEDFEALVETWLSQLDFNQFLVFSLSFGNRYFNMLNDPSNPHRMDHGDFQNLAAQGYNMQHVFFSILGFNPLDVNTWPAGWWPEHVTTDGFSTNLVYTIISSGLADLEGLANKLSYTHQDSLYRAMFYRVLFYAGLGAWDMLPIGMSLNVNPTQPGVGWFRVMYDTLADGEHMPELPQGYASWDEALAHWQLEYEVWINGGGGNPTKPPAPSPLGNPKIGIQGPNGPNSPNAFNLRRFPL